MPKRDRTALAILCPLRHTVGYALPRLRQSAATGRRARLPTLRAGPAASELEQLGTDRCFLAQTSAGFECQLAKNQAMKVMMQPQETNAMPRQTPAPPRIWYTIMESPFGPVCVAGTKAGLLPGPPTVEFLSEE